MLKPPKKVLIITYYWPPSGGSGVQRWVKFVKYLREFGWEPIIYTPSNPEFPELDPSLEKDIPNDLEILKQPIWEPYNFYKKFVGLKKETRLKTGLVQVKENVTFPKKVSVWIRGNLFIPDARKFWIKPSVKFLFQYVKRNPVDVVVSNGTPHSLHLIGLGLKEKLNIPWLADFRDPWTNIDFFDDLMLTNWAKKKHHKLEKKVLQKANCVTVTTPGTKKDFLSISPESFIEVITNGYDSDDFVQKDISPENKFIVAHIGVLTPSRNHPFFWDIVKKLTDENPDFASHFLLRFIGSIDESIRNEINKRKLNKYVEILDYVPHEQIIAELKKARVLLLKIRNSQNQKTIIPGKIFEYLAANRPIISIGPKGSDSDHILKLSDSGVTFDITDKDKLENHLLNLFVSYKHGNISIPNSKNIEQFSRRNLTEKMASVLNKISQ